MAKKVVPLQGIGDFLKLRYSKRVATNRQYSLRAFARDLGISSGRLTNLLNEKNTPSIRTLEKIRFALQLSQSDYLHLLELSEKTRLQQNETRGHDIVLTDEHLGLVVDWLPYAILSLTKTEDFKMDPSIIASRFEVSESAVDNAIEDLRSAGLLVYQEGKWGSSKQKITTTFEVPSLKIRQSHKEKFKIAAKKLDETDITLRDFSSITFPANLEKLSEAKALLSQFRRQLAELFEDGNLQEVYCLSMQLFPLSKKEKQENGN